MTRTLSRLKIFQALTAENPPPIPFNDETVTLSDPTPSVDPNPGQGDEWNTKITVTAKPGSGYTGSVDVYYRRNDLRKFEGTASLVQECRFTTDTFLDALNRCQTVALGWEDLEPFDPKRLPCRAGVIRCIELKALDTSLGWFGTVVVPVVIGIPAEANALHQLIHNTLPSPGYW